MANTTLILDMDNLTPEIIEKEGYKDVFDFLADILRHKIGKEYKEAIISNSLESGSWKGPFQKKNPHYSTPGFCYSVDSFKDVSDMMFNCLPVGIMFKKTEEKKKDV